jgi:hypothetical protein
VIQFLWMKNTTVKYRVWIGATTLSILLRLTPLCRMICARRLETLYLSHFRSNFELSKKNSTYTLRPLISWYILTLGNQTNGLHRKVGHQLFGDVRSHHRRTETAIKAFLWVGVSRWFLKAYLVNECRIEGQFFFYSVGFPDVLQPYGLLNYP